MTLESSNVVLSLAQQQEVLRKLSEDKSLLDARFARLDARREADEKEWARIAESLREQYGTTDLQKIRERLDVERKENSDALLSCVAEIDTLKARCSEVEALLARADTGEFGELPGV